MAITEAVNECEEVGETLEDYIDLIRRLAQTHGTDVLIDTLEAALEPFEYLFMPVA